jgi:hypothetical protein
LSKNYPNGASSQFERMQRIDVNSICPRGSI